MLARRRLGRNGPEVSMIGLGCMGFSGTYGPADDKESIAVIQAAIDMGVTFLDTGDFYGMGHNEMLIGQAIKGRRDSVFLSVKFGMQRGPSGPPLGYDARPQAVKTALAYTLRRLGTDYVDLYQPARVDMNVPVEDTVGAIGELIEAGYVRHVGLSEVSAATIRRASAVRPIAALQTEYSVAHRQIEQDTLPVLDALGMGLVAYGILARGILGADIKSRDSLAKGDIRVQQPRYSGDNLEHNLAAVAALETIAREAGLTPAQAALGWVLAQGEHIVPLVGTRRKQRLAEAVAAANKPLAPDVLAALEDAFPANAIRGERYPPDHMGAVGR